jgi:hypothetical protein
MVRAVTVPRAGRYRFMCFAAIQKKRARGRRSLPPWRTSRSTTTNLRQGTTTKHPVVPATGAVVGTAGWRPVKINQHCHWQPSSEQIALR